jgi:hypothetical protein
MLCCNGYVAGGGGTINNCQDCRNTSTRLRNSFAPSTKRKIVTPETNVVFMIPSSATGRSYLNKGGLNNLSHGSSARRYINTYVD